MHHFFDHHDDLNHICLLANAATQTQLHVLQAFINLVVVFQMVYPDAQERLVEFWMACAQVDLHNHAMVKQSQHAGDPCKALDIPYTHGWQGVPRGMPMYGQVGKSVLQLFWLCHQHWVATGHKSIRRILSNQLPKEVSTRWWLQAADLLPSQRSKVKAQRWSLGQIILGDCRNLQGMMVDRIILLWKLQPHPSCEGIFGMKVSKGSLQVLLRATMRFSNLLHAIFQHVNKLCCEVASIMIGERP